MRIRQKFNVILSVGTVYSQLYALERKCVIVGKTAGSGTRKYCLTPEGERATETILAQKKRISKVMDSMFKD
jgi:DNA-binding PadR family transcriptional regulator